MNYKLSRKCQITCPCSGAGEYRAFSRRTHSEQISCIYEEEKIIVLISKVVRIDATYEECVVRNI
jgi:hypothetical protein